MSKYEVFKALLDFVAEEFEVTDADMNNYCGEIEISGKANGKIIKIKASITEEEKKDD